MVGIENAFAGSQPVVKSTSGDTSLRVAGSDWFPAHQGTSIDPGMEIRVADNAVLEAVAGNSLQFFIIGPAQVALPKKKKSEPGSPDLLLTRGHIAISFSAGDSDSTFVIQTDSGNIEIKSGLISVALLQSNSLKIAVSDGRACFKKTDAKQICADEKKMIVADPTPKLSNVEQSFEKIWKKFDWSVGGVKPDLKVVQPQEGAYFTDSSITILGTTSKGATVKVNNKDMSVKADGSFVGNITLYEGENKISIQAYSRSGKSISLTRSVFLDTTPPLLTVSQPPPNFDPTTVGTCDSQNYYVQIFGITEPGVSLSANGVNVSRYIEDDGSFLIQDFAIRRGEKTLIIEAEDMHRRKTREVLHINEPSDPSSCR